MSALDEIVKAYDIRGTVPDQLNESVAHALGVGFAKLANSDRVLVARDMRESGVALVDEFCRGVMEQGLDVVDLGLASTDMVYFAAGVLDAPGAMFTASHNPAQYNGVKFCLAGAKPVGIDSGLAEIRATSSTVLDGVGPPPAATTGSRSTQDVLPDFVEHVLSFVDVEADRSAEGGGRHRERDGWPGRPCGVRTVADDRSRGDVRRTRRFVPEPPRRSVAAGEPARPPRSGLHRRLRSRARRSTATPTGSSWSTSWGRV